MNDDDWDVELAVASFIALVGVVGFACYFFGLIAN